MWQQEYPGLARPDFEFVAIAVDPGGADDARPYVEAAAATFPVLVNSVGASSIELGFTVVPNGLLVDEVGVIRYRKDGGFSNAQPRDLEAVRRFANGEDPGPGPERAPAPYELDARSRELVATKMELGRALFALGRRDDAIARWREAIHLDPENKTIRKPIWAIEHPERFHPVIDEAWQGEQFERERAEEIATGVCGPDGCPLPSR